MCIVRVGNGNIVDLVEHISLLKSCLGRSTFGQHGNDGETFSGLLRVYHDPQPTAMPF